MTVVAVRIVKLTTKRGLQAQLALDLDPAEDELHKGRHARVNVEQVGAQLELGRGRRLVRRRNSGEVGKLAGARAAVKAFGIARLAYVERRVDEYLAEILLVRCANAVAVGAIRRNECADRDHACFSEERRNFAHAANILGAVGRRKTQISVQPLADVVAVQHVALTSFVEERALESDGKGRLPRAGQTGEPDNRAAVTIHAHAILRRNMMANRHEVNRLRLYDHVIVGFSAQLHASRRM